MIIGKDRTNMPVTSSEEFDELAGNIKPLYKHSVEFEGTYLNNECHGNFDFYNNSPDEVSLENNKTYLLLGTFDGLLLCSDSNIDHTIIKIMKIRTVDENDVLVLNYYGIDNDDGSLLYKETNIVITSMSDEVTEL